MNRSEFLNTVEEKIAKHHLLNHTFYKSWNAGELDRSVIQEYAAQYFKHVSSFPRYLSSIHSNCDDIAIRQEILENLIDEERGEENHPELWMRFAEGMGKDRASVKKTAAIKETEELVTNFMKLSKDEKYHKGFGALYCYESMIPEIAENKIDGLIKYYGAEKGDETLKFFEVHKSADIIHRQVIKQLLGDVCDSDLKKEETLEAIDLALSSLNNFLSGIERVYC
jgi:pyrroloquinoline-quinone synthase